MNTNNNLKFTSLEAENNYNYLYNKYNTLSIGKDELATEIYMSKSSINSYIVKGYGIPNYFKVGTSKNASVRFNIIDVAEFMSNTIKTA